MKRPPRKYFQAEFDVEFYKGDLYAVAFNVVGKITPGKKPTGEDDLEVHGLREGPYNPAQDDEQYNEDPTERVVRVAGAPGLAAGVEGGPATAGGLYLAMDVAFDRFGNMFIASSFAVGAGGTVKKVDVGEVDPQDPEAARIDGCVEEKIEGEPICRPLDPLEIMTTVAGLRDGGKGYIAEPSPAKASPLYRPSGLAFDRHGNLYISDTYNHRVRKVSAGIDGEINGTDDEIITTVAGTGVGPAAAPGYGMDNPDEGPLNAGKWGWDGDAFDDPPTRAFLDTPRHIEVDEANNLYVADSENDRVRRISPGVDGELGTEDDTITTVAGRPPGGRDDNAGANPVDHHPTLRRCHDRAPGGQPRVCSPLDVKLEHPYGLAIAPCKSGALTTDMYVSEWMNRRVRVISGVAQCPNMDLWLEDITDTPDPVTVGSDLKYSIKATNTGPSEATGVKVTNALPAGSVLKSATFPGGNCNLEGAHLVCPVGRLGGGEAVNIELTVTPTTPGQIFLTSTIKALNPKETNNVDNSETEGTQVGLPGLPALAVPALPCLVGCNAGGHPPAAPDGPPPGSTPPGTSIDPNQSSVTLAPPGGTGSATPSTAPVPGPASQISGQQVPLTGSLGFQSGPAPGASASPAQELVGAGSGAPAVSALADTSEEQAPQTAPRYSMVSADTALKTAIGLTTGAALLGFACIVFVGSFPARGRAAPSWASGPSRSRAGPKPAL